MIVSLNPASNQKLVTTLTVGLASLLGLVCSKRVSAGGIQSVFGRIGIVTAVLSALLWTTVIWEMVEFDDFFGRAIAITSVVSFAMAHLLIVWREGGSRMIRGVTHATVVLILIVSRQIRDQQADGRDDQEAAERARSSRAGLIQTQDRPGG